MDKKTVNDDLYSACVNIYGKDAQANQLQEECAELITAVNHFRRERIPSTKLIEEMCDVAIMIEQMLHILARDPSTDPYTLFKVIKQAKITKIELAIIAKRNNVSRN